MPNGKALAFFPTPYPDEIFYSVLCRYHLRCGDPAFVSTANTIWGKNISANLYLPQSLGGVANRLPKGSRLTAEYFALNNTIYPFLKPFLPQERGQQVLELLKSDSQHTVMAYQLCGLPNSKSARWQYLRYCEDCREEDIRLYGESYWHRLHQISGILVCPVHGNPLQNSSVFLKDIQTKFHAAPFEATTAKPVQPFSNDITEKLIGVAQDAEWIMRNGNTLPFSEKMTELYNQLLRAKGYRCLSGRRTKHQVLYQDVLEFYGQELLDVLGVHSQGVVSWTERIMHKRYSLLYPVYYLLLMRFLAGSVEDFFTKKHSTVHPYGMSPWPCRNPVCPHYLQDVIVDLPELIQFASRHQATFTCPHCGFSYKRSRMKQKGDQYAGQISKEEYGWLWLDNFKEMMESGMPIMRICEKLQCGFQTVKRLGVEMEYLSSDQMPKKKTKNYYKPKPVIETIQKPTSKAYYREQWLQAIKDNSDASRSLLIRIIPEIYQWLRENDLEWYEANAPASKQYTARDWTDYDEYSLEKARVAVSYLKGLPGRPVCVNRRSIEKYGGLNNLYKNLANGYLPKTQVYLNEVLETDEVWRKRKIEWAVKELYESGKNLLLPQIQIKAAISHEYFAPLEAFALGCIEQIQK
ncbi:MAG: TnsD family transposase [Clostridiales bacterium]|jgi:hypothetical protein|nr:TnsD family transposase [Clostridiales bacterium]